METNKPDELLTVEKLTKADRSALERMPDGWFDPYDLPPIIRCPRFRCGRLHDLGALDWKVIGEYPNLESRYRKREITQ